MAIDIRTQVGPALRQPRGEPLSAEALLPLLVEYTEKVREGFIHWQRSRWTAALLRLVFLIVLGTLLGACAVGLAHSEGGAAYWLMAVAAVAGIAGGGLALFFPSFPESRLVEMTLRANGETLRRLVQAGSQCYENKAVEGDLAAELRGRLDEADAVFAAAENAITRPARLYLA